MDLEPFKGRTVYIYTRAGFFHGTITEAKTNRAVLEGEHGRVTLDPKTVEAVREPKEAGK